MNIQYPISNKEHPMSKWNALRGNGLFFDRINRIGLAGDLLTSPERAAFTSVGQRPTKRVKKQLSPVRATSFDYALTGLGILFDPIRRALPYASECRAFSPHGSPGRRRPTLGDRKGRPYRLRGLRAFV